MLNAMREGAKSGFTKFILFGFMVMAVGGLIFMDIGGFFRGGVTNSGVAKIGREELPLMTFDQSLRRTLSRQGLDAQTAYKFGFVHQVLNSEISQNLLHREAADLGLQVDDNAVLVKVNQILAPLVGENTDKKAALNAILRNQGLSEREFIRMIKAEMTNNLLQNAIVSATATPAEQLASDIYLYNNEQRTVKAVFLPHSNIKEVPEVTDEILLPFYQAGQERYAIPETRTFTIATLSQDKLSKTLDISDEELREIYEQDIASYEKPEQRVLEQAVLDTEAKATAIAESAKKGTDLKQAVTDETGSTDAWLGEETFEQGGIPEEMAEAFAVDKGGIVGPVETALGWHVLKVKDVIAPATDSFEKVKKSLKEEMLHLRVADEMFAASGQMDDYFAGGMPLEEVAAEMGLETTQYGPVKRDGSTTDDKDGMKAFGPDWGYVLETVFDQMQGEISPVFELKDGRYAAIRVDTITEKTYKPFEEVRDQLAKIWVQDQKEVANKLLAEAALNNLQNGTADLSAIASSNKAEIKTYKLSRAEDAAAPFDPQSKDSVFSMPEGNYGLTAVKDGYIISQVTQISLPESEKIAKDKFEPLVETTKQNEQGEIMQMYLNALYDQYDVKINARLLQATYGPGSEQF